MTEVVEVKARRFELTDAERAQRLVDLQEFLQDMVVSLTGRETVTVTVPTSAQWQQGNDVQIRVSVADEDQLRLTIGPRKSVVQTLLQFVRAQQIMPHNKVVTLVIETSDGSKVQTFKDAHLFGFNTKNVPADDFYRLNGIPAPHTRTLNLHVAKSKEKKAAPSETTRGAKLRNKD